MSIYDTLNSQQQEAVFRTEGPVLILAGAGSGKTRVLTHRIAYLIEEKGVNPWNIMAITFTNKAAEEMRDRVDKLVGFGAESVWVSTFHSSCVRILRRYIDRLGYSNNFTIYDTDDQKTLMKDICKRLNIDTKVYKERAIMSAVSSAKDELISPEEYELNTMGDFGKKKIALAYKEYQKQLKKNNALDFDDLIVKTVELFQACPDVLESYQERFRYLMVDEYQDTNTAQFKFVSLLASKYQNLCVVGDDDQSIYKFRGANIGNILGYEKVFPNAKVIKLEQNYRSTQNILNSANEVIRNNLGRKSKTLWTDNEEGALLHFRQFMNGFEEAEYITGDISQKVREGECSYKDCAILYRTNAQSRLFEEKFLMSNIPYKMVGGVNFYARKEIKDLLAYLKTVDNARDDIAVRRIINVPKRGIGLTTITRVQDYADANGISFYDALRTADEIPSLGRGAAKIRPFVTFIQSLRSKAEYLSVTELLDDIIEETGYVADLKAEDTDEANARIENIDELITKVVTYEEGTDTPSLGEFLEEVALIADIDTVDTNSDRVLMMTLHSAKGLEFPYVYMAGMEDGIFPSYMTIVADDPTEIEEERRLCYVGITRAMKDLTLTCAQQRMIRGETQYNKVSRFIREIPRELVDMGQSFQERKVKDIPLPSGFQQMRQAFKSQAFQPRQFEVKKSEGLSYGVGDTVKHIKFGVGIVENIAEGGKDYEVTVNFDKAGVKKMFASFAKLKKI
ncbi:DNA helicase PcrA [Lactonifactor sp. BIOML-A3]|uniref:DNA helicase PcrA n=1 Tax=Lactonifactor TaxID=420345 RepID=UPI0012B0777F|nr:MULTISPECIES: DNA helicase PcrA [Lactonifactor]MCB5714250.1 DNA helicase PcrA [Lactonifactor longoviformis]MCB5718205.1 DNA helicase PcrA [Lactonifactor longoviformis]MSA03616.1 DNA helicase PcrA [Lactonifactor sp. BIOML-A5]MSA10117.1 DNA helicase PcrA [Lactonifactor sp. BIOML-A4]MSA14623.1 DNA helicase PcrA [Lactonifactor sp. BIOML-A3]